MNRTYTPAEAKKIDWYLRQRFEAALDVFASEATDRDYRKGPDGSYINEHIQTIWVGYQLVYMVVRKTPDGDFMDIKPGMLPEVEEYIRSTHIHDACG